MRTPTLLLQPLRLSTLALAATALAPSLAARAKSIPDALAAELVALAEAHEGDVAIAVKRLPAGDEFAYRADLPMPTASLVKLPLMATAYRAVDAGRLDPQQLLTLRAEDKVPGSGILTEQFSAGLQLSLHDAIHLMIIHSDNTATNLVAEAVGLPETAKYMEELGLPETKLHSLVYRRETSIFPERSQLYGLGSTTAADMVKLLELLDAGKLGSKASTDAMRGHLYACLDRTKLGRFLPPGVKLAHKTGAVNLTRTDAGLIDLPEGRLAICVLTNNNADQSWGAENAAEVLIGKIAAAAYRHYAPNGPAKPTDDGPQTLAMGASGELVAALQRTINARTTPSAGLAVDGDFGPNTESGVRAFQRSRGLPETGIVDAATWEALGPLATEDPKAPEPDALNTAKLPRDPADPLDGPPFTASKAWAILDADTGELLWGLKPDEPRDMASTTKIMTAYVVLRYAAEHPEILDETVTFSKRADDTIGSTADVRVGEQVSVRELLYGMMLPSGNDATVAFAEHFGARLGSPQPSEPSEISARSAAYDAFVAAMNRTAAELGLAATQFANTHGLTAEGHHASAHDLAKLARAAFELPLFKDVVGTRQRGATVTGPGGYRRNVAWYNTNRLLATEGYYGVKTGTTTAAGACLVSAGERDGRRLIVAVLGAESSESRYADSRNLYRWAWNQLLGLSPQAAATPRTSVLATAIHAPASRDPVVLTPAAERLHRSSLVVDGHNDMPWEVRTQAGGSFDKLDVSQPQSSLQTDIPRLRRGGVGAQFWSVWVPVYTARRGQALSTTLEQIDLVQTMIARYPDAFELALTADDIVRIHRSGKIASLIGVEGGHSIEGSLAALRQLHRLGARYMTLTHSDSLDWADSGTDKPKAGGLAPFGVEVVREMNRLGMMVDISHVSPDAMKQTLAATRAPVIFSHSSAGGVADHPRNVPDDVLPLVRDNGGVVMVNFFSAFIVPQSAERDKQRFVELRKLEAEYGDDRPAIEAGLARWDATRPTLRGTIHDLLDHIDHIVRIAGIDHVGLGSDYDGVSLLPTQLEDAASYPYITQGLLDRGYSGADVKKVLGENLLRVMRRTEDVAREIAAESTAH
ncbi:MAG: membrane dipeptidase [Pirellulales bacterium]|nr:membrane dipeptidase [Pirellulales bacterium]